MLNSDMLTDNGLGHLEHTILIIFARLTVMKIKYLVFLRASIKPRLMWLNTGEMAEWSNAAVSKTVVRLPANRGFESPSLRNA